MTNQTVYADGAFVKEETGGRKGQKNTLNFEKALPLLENSRRGGGRELGYIGWILFL